MTHPLRRYIKRHDITWESMAGRIGTSRVSLQRICDGKQTPSVSMIKRIVRATGGEVAASELVATAPEE